MFALPIVFILLAGLARTSPAGTVPPASTITPAPVLDRRYLADDFVGYAFMDDGDITTITCNEPYTYTYTGGYADCAEYSTEIATSCYGSTIYYLGSGSFETCSSTCVTDMIYYSTDDSEPAWMVRCATRSAWAVYHMSIEEFNLITVTERITLTETDTPPSTKVTSETATTGEGQETSTLSPLPTAGKKNNGAIIGGAVAGALVFLGLVIAGAFFFFAKRRKNHDPSKPAGGQSVQGQQPPMMNQDQPVAMSPNPMSSGPFSPQPYNQQPYSQHGRAFSPPPAYGQEKGAAATVAPVERTPVQFEHRAPEVEAGIYEAYGNSINPPMSPVPAPAAHLNELPGPRSQHQTMPPQGRSELG